MTWSDRRLQSLWIASWFSSELKTPKTPAKTTTTTGNQNQNQNQIQLQLQAFDHRTEPGAAELFHKDQFGGLEGFFNNNTNQHKQLRIGTATAGAPPSFLFGLKRSNKSKNYVWPLKQHWETRVEVRETRFIEETKGNRMGDTVFQSRNQNSIYVLNSNYNSYDDFSPPPIIDTFDHSKKTPTSSSISRSLQHKFKTLANFSASATATATATGSDPTELLPPADAPPMMPPPPPPPSSSLMCSQTAVAIQKLFNCSSSCDQNIVSGIRRPGMAEREVVNRSIGCTGGKNKCSSSTSVKSTLLAKKTKFLKYLEEEKSHATGSDEGYGQTKYKSDLSNGYPGDSHNSSTAGQWPSDNWPQNHQQHHQQQQKSHKRKSSYELYKEAAELMGISCTLCDNCRCIDCQGGYFDCDDSDSYSDNSFMDEYDVEMLTASITAGAHNNAHDHHGPPPPPPIRDVESSSSCCDDSTFYHYQSESHHHHQPEQDYECFDSNCNMAAAAHSDEDENSAGAVALASSSSPSSTKDFLSLDARVYDGRCLSFAYDPIEQLPQHAGQNDGDDNDDDNDVNSITQRKRQTVQTTAEPNQELQCQWQERRHQCDEMENFVNFSELSLSGRNAGGRTAAGVLARNESPITVQKHSN